MIGKIANLKVMLFMVTRSSDAFETLSEVDKCIWEVSDQQGMGLQDLDLKDIFGDTALSYAAQAGYRLWPKNAYWHSEHLSMVKYMLNVTKWNITTLYKYSNGEQHTLLSTVVQSRSHHNNPHNFWVEFVQFLLFLV